MTNKLILVIISILFFSKNSIAQVTENFIDSRDGKTYRVVRIGKQTWMAENLDFKKESGCWEYNNDQNTATYGFLYNWETAKSVCPTGWHLPSNVEFATLANYLEGDSIAGGNLKETGIVHWVKPNSGATNICGFQALPGGFRDFNEGRIMNVGRNGIWWSSTEYNQSSSCNLILGTDYKRAIKGKANKSYGFSVRCLKN